MYTGLFRLKMGAKSHGGNTEVPYALRMCSMVFVCSRRL